MELEEKIIEELKELSLRDLPPRDVALSYKVFDSIPITMNGKCDINKLIACIEKT